VVDTIVTTSFLFIQLILNSFSQGSLKYIIQFCAMLLILSALTASTLRLWGVNRDMIIILVYSHLISLV